MKKLIPFCLFIFIHGISTSLLGQTIVSADGTRKLYLELANPMSIMIKDCPCSDIRVEVTQGKTTKEAPCKFTYKPDSLGYVTFYIYQVGKKNRQKTPFRYKVYSLPELNARIGKSYGGDTAKEFLLVEQGLKYEIAEDLIICDVRSKVESFTFIILRNNYLIFAENNVSNSFTATEKDAMRNLQKGDKVLMINIKGSVFDKIYNLKPIEFTIKE